MAWGDEPIQAEAVRRKHKPEARKSTAKKVEDPIVVSTDQKEVLAKKPNEKVQWFARAVELARHGTIKVNVLYDLLSHPKFFLGMEAVEAKSSCGGQLRATVDKNIDLFSAKQQKLLHSDSCKLSTFVAEASSDSDEDAAKATGQDAEGASETKAGFKAIFFKKDADKAPQFSGFKKLTEDKKDKKDKSSKGGDDASARANHRSAQRDVNGTAGVDESDGADKRGPSKPAISFQPTGNLNALLEMGKQSVAQAKSDLKALEQLKQEKEQLKQAASSQSSRPSVAASADPARSERGGRRGGQRSGSRSRGRGASRGSRSRSRQPHRSNSRSRRPCRSKSRSHRRSRSKSRSRSRGRGSRRPSSKSHHVWRQRGIDYMKDAGLFEKRGRPEVGSRLKSCPPPHILDWMLEEGHVREEKPVKDDDL